DHGVTRGEPIRIPPPTSRAEISGGATVVAADLPAPPASTTAASTTAASTTAASAPAPAAAASAVPRPVAPAVAPAAPAAKAPPPVVARVAASPREPVSERQTDSNALLPVAAPTE